MNNHSSFYFSVILHYSQDMLLTKPTRHFTLTLKKKKNPKNPTQEGMHINRDVTIFDVTSPLRCSTIVSMC